MSYDQGFDVFLTYNSRDRPKVLDLYGALEERGVRAWLDVKHLPLGRPWQAEVEAVIASIPVAAALIGPAGRGPWQEQEIRAALEQFVKRYAPVIPVLLPGAQEKPDLPLFLQGFSWADLRTDHSEQLDRLVEAIVRQRSAARSKGPPLHNLRLDSIGSLFHGRDALLAQLAHDLEADSAAALTQRKVLHGLGGIGKTRLAVEYACGVRGTATPRSSSSSRRVQRRFAAAWPSLLGRA